MSMDLLRQNTETLIELTNNYNKLSSQREELNERIETAKARKLKSELEKNQRELEEVNIRLKLVKNYILKLIVKMDKLVEEEKNAL
ncbi:MAG: hypothetical protein AB1571_01845 [Nanoarchaeota archaeon]